MQVTNTSTFPADVADRRTLGENTIADADVLEFCGLQYEADELRRSTNKISLHKEAAQLTVDVWHEGEEPPALKPWQLHVMTDCQKPLS